jgi:hypothetical protein
VRVRTLYGLSKLGRRTAPRAPAAVG